MRKLGKNLAMYICMFVAVFCVMSLKAEAANVTSGTIGERDSITWTYDADTKTLTLTGDGELEEVDWYYAERLVLICPDVEIIKVKDCKLSSCTNMFNELEYVKSITFENFDTSNVLSMYSMFNGCSNLTNVDVSGFNTSKVTNMSYMFKGCSSLVSLDVSKFDTTKVANMSRMFDGCTSLTVLDVSGFKTSNVQKMNHMFKECSLLTNVDVSGFDTSKVTDMSSMFQKCSALTVLDVSGFDTSNVTEMEYMFSWCSKLESLDVSNFDTSKVTAMNYMFFDCDTLTELNVSNFDTSNVQYFMQMFYTCEHLKTLDISSFEFTSVQDESHLQMMLDWCNSMETIKTPKSVGDFSIRLPYAFSDAEGNLVDVITDAVCNMTLEKLLVVPVSSIQLDVENAILKSGQSIQVRATVSPKNASNKEVVWESSDTGVATVSSGGKVTAVAPGTATITVVAGDGYGASASCEVTVVSSTSGYLGERNSIYWTYDKDTKILTLTGDGELETVGWFGTEILRDICPDVEIIKVKNCKLSSCRYMFGSLNKVQSITFENFDTSCVTDMSSMFSNCNSLSSLDVSAFDTSCVTDMSGMFSSCESLSSLNVSNFDTSHVTGMSGMFYGCESLSSLNVSNFDTSQVTAMTAMFSGCKSLSSLNLGDFDTAKVDNMTAMFYFCENLSSLDVSGFDTSNVTSMVAMFQGCKNLSNLNLSNFDTAKVTMMPAMFADCESLKNLDVSNFIISQGTELSSIFAGCNALEVIYTFKDMKEGVKVELPGTFADLNQKQTTSLTKEFCNTTLVNINNLVTGVSVSPASAELKPGDTKQLQATVTPTKAAIKDVTWTSSNTAVATVDAIGKVTAVGEGTATITATAKDGSGKSATCIVTVTEPVPETPEDLLKAFVERMYTVALGRAAETEGLNFYVQRLLSGDSNGACLAESFLCSPEFLNKGHSDAEYVKVLYRTFFDREPAAEEVNYWVDKLSNGQTKAFVLSGFVNSYEFDNLCAQYGISRGFMREDGKPLNPGIGRFAERMYTVVLERAGEKEGIEYWSLSIANGVCTPKDAAKNFFLSPEYVNKNTSDAQYITTLYKAFMDREPEAGGVEYWQNVLKNGATREQILEGFADSAEFKGIMESFGL